MKTIKLFGLIKILEKREKDKERNKDIMKIFKEPNAPLPIAIVNRLKVGERSSGEEKR